MKTYVKGAIVFIIIIIMAFMVGSYILSATFFGLISLVGLIVLIESIPPLKWVMERTSKVVDIVIFIFTIMATVSYGLNIAASLTVAGVGYTLVYAPYLKEKRRERSNAKKAIGNYKSKFNFK
jgi:hypothetical protein